MHWFIHSYQRASSSNFITLNFLSPLPRDQIHIVVQLREAQQYAHYVERYGVDILVLPDNIRKLSPTRQWIMNWAYRQGIIKVGLMDDDLRLFKRTAPTENARFVNYSLLNATDQDVLDAMDMLSTWLDSYAHVGVSYRQGNQHYEETEAEARRMGGMIAYRADLFHQLGIRFDRIDLKQDMDVTMQFIRAGYPNKVSYYYAIGQAQRTGAPGGASTYRTKELLARCAHELAALHPGYVKVVEKETINAWQQTPNRFDPETNSYQFPPVTRTDVMCYWDRASKSTQRRTVPMPEPYHYRYQEPPFTLKFELTEGCDLRCPFCGIHGIRGSTRTDQRYLFATVETARRLAAQVSALGWTTRWELAGRGEPLLNPNATEIIQVIREELPESSIMVTSNGGNLLHDPGPVDRVKALFDAGLNCLALDDYIGVPIVPRIRLALNRPMPGIQVYNYPPDSGGNPYIRRKSTDRIITYLADLTTTAGDHKIGVRDNICNQTGAAGPLNDRFKGHRCARPFRELCVRFDGRLMLCCNDWRGQFKVGSVMDKPLNELWQADQLQAARLKLYHGDREWGPCKGCDSKSYRPGLLPDPMGRAILPLATARDEAILEMACAGDSMTQAVLRPWEQPSAVIEPQLLNEPFVRREPMEMSEPRDMREPGI